jgi:hypothetical protein
MGTYPWGPHGPQSGPNQVTPNPTPAYVPPASSGWDAPATSSSPAYGGGYSGSGGGFAGYSGPYRKSYILAIILTCLFGPLGLFYASKKGGLIMLLFLLGVPIGLNELGKFHYGYAMGDPFSILERSVVMDPMLKITVVFSLIWAVIAVRKYNKALKARKNAEQATAA